MHTQYRTYSKLNVIPLITLGKFDYVVSCHSSCPFITVQLSPTVYMWKICSNIQLAMLRESVDIPLSIVITNG